MPGFDVTAPDPLTGEGFVTAGLTADVALLVAVDEVLVDLFNAIGVTVLAVLTAGVTVFDVAGVCLTVPAPNVPEFIIYLHCQLCLKSIVLKTNLSN